METWYLIVISFAFPRLLMILRTFSWTCFPFLCLLCKTGGQSVEVLKCSRPSTSEAALAPPMRILWIYTSGQPQVHLELRRVTFEKVSCHPVDNLGSVPSSACGPGALASLWTGFVSRSWLLCSCCSFADSHPWFPFCVALLIPGLPLLLPPGFCQSQG